MKKWKNPKECKVCKEKAERVTLSDIFKKDYNFYKYHLCNKHYKIFKTFKKGKALAVYFFPYCVDFIDKHIPE